MEPIIDNFHCIGEMHIRASMPCQDYSRVFQDWSKGMYIGAISDGCSGSLGDPSFGSAYLVNEFIQIAKSDALKEVEGADVKHTLLISIQDLIEKGYNLEDFLATLIGMIKTPDMLKVFWYGDGCVIKEFKNGITEVLRIDYPGNAPCYLTYNVSPGMYQQFRSAYGGKATLYKSWFDMDGELIKGEVLDIDGSGLVLDLTEEMDNLFSVTITSDGIDQLKTEEGYLPLSKAAATMTDFKSVSSGFITRLCGFHFRRKRTFTPDDDYSQVSLCLR